MSHTLSVLGLLYGPPILFGLVSYIISIKLFRINSMKKKIPIHLHPDTTNGYGVMFSQEEESRCVGVILGGLTFIRMEDTLLIAGTLEIYFNGPVTYTGVKLARRIIEMCNSSDEIDHFRGSVFYYN
jgi:hypothetical protein